MTTETPTIMRQALGELRESLTYDNPVDLTDGELVELAALATDELARRLPRYALDQGDLDESDEPEIRAREILRDDVAEYRVTRHAS